ncbi:MAG: hypothetical protein AVDCRST_MAG05-2331, partial [uncultured Rubrobacteraceae bacterium]
GPQAHRGLEPGNGVEDRLQGLEVRLYQLGDAGVLDLYRHGPPVQQRRAVDLGDGGCGDGLALEMGEDLVHGSPELADDNLLDNARRLRGHAILQRRQLLGVRGGEEVRAGGGELSRLYKRPAQRLRRVEQHPRPPLVRQMPVRLSDGRGQPPLPLPERRVRQVQVRGQRPEHERPRRQGPSRRRAPAGPLAGGQPRARPEKPLRPREVAEAKGCGGVRHAGGHSLAPPGRRAPGGPREHLPGPERRLPPRPQRHVLPPVTVGEYTRGVRAARRTGRRPRLEGRPNRPRARRVERSPPALLCFAPDPVGVRPTRPRGPV